MDVPIETIILDPRLQMRATMDFSTIDEYAETIDELPPGKIIMGPQEQMWLTGGWHRYHANVKAKRQTMRCEVREGSFQDALKEAAGENYGHGIKRTDADKRRAVTALLTDEEWAKRSDRMIAEACHVGPHLVASVREDISTVRAHSSNSQNGESTQTNSGEGEEEEPEGEPEKEKPKRTGKDGKKRAAAKPKVLCPRCERVGEAKGCVMCAELRKRKKKPKAKPKAESGDAPKDAFGVELPKNVRKAYLDPWIQDAFDYLCGLEEGLRHQRLADGMSKRKATYPFFNAKDFIDGVGMAMNTLDDLLQHIKEFRPAGVCPACNGECCAQCRMSGLVPRELHAKLKKASKP
jgi:hypothetical protein